VLLKERELGTAILLISEELDELMSLSDRIIAIYEGRNMGELTPEVATLTEIGLMMAGTPRGGKDTGRGNSPVRSRAIHCEG